jgi:hypothetical protein
MPTLFERPPTDDKPLDKHKREPLSITRILLPISLMVGCILIIVASLQNPNKTEEEQLEELQAKIEKREALLVHEKESYCELLWKIKKVRLCACKKNFIKDIGSLTGYKVKKDSDIDWRNSGKTFEDALQEAFKRTGVPKDQFSERKWAKDINGKSGVVEWRALGGAEVSIDAPHTNVGPDVFHIGFQSKGKGKDQTSGHIFLDCVPYFRDIDK